MLLDSGTILLSVVCPFRRLSQRETSLELVTSEQGVASINGEGIPIRLKEKSRIDANTLLRLVGAVRGACVWRGESCRNSAAGAYFSSKTRKFCH